MPMVYVVIENTPGYLPEDNDPGVFDTYEEAVAYANELCDQLEDDLGYVMDRSWASRGNYFCAKGTRPDHEHDLGRIVEVIREDDPDEAE